MSVSSSQAITSNVVLRDPSDWDEWIAVVKSRARYTNISSAIDFEKKEKPVQPTEPARPTLHQFHANATALSVLTPEQEKDYKLAYELWKQDTLTYRAQILALQDIQNFIMKSIDKKHIRYANQETVWDALVSLKQRLAPTDRARKYELSKQYQELQKGPKGQQTEKWIQEWEKVLSDAEKLQLAEVQDDKPLYDFLNAVRGINPGFADGRDSVLEERQLTGIKLPTVYQMVEQYRNYIRIAKVSSKSSTHTAFGGTLQGNQQQGSQRTQTSSVHKPCLCGEDHRFSGCPYLIPQARTKGWTPDPQIDQTIKEKLAKNERLATAVDKAREWVQKKQGTAKEKPAENSIRGSFAVRAALAADSQPYKLKNCWTLDSGTDIHICNDRSRFKFEKSALKTDTLIAGKATYTIEAFGSVNITVNTPEGPSIVQLLNVALVPGFFTSLVCLRRFTEKGVHWDTQNERLHSNGEIFCYTKSVDDHWVLEYHEPAENAEISASFATSRGPRPQAAKSAAQWHTALGHPGPDAISHLETAVDGIAVTGQAPTTIQCEVCSLSKAHHVISRRSEKEDPAEDPLARVAYDLISLSTAYNGYKWVSHFTCYQTTMDFVYCHARKSQALDTIREFLNMVRTRFGRRVKYFRTDGERTLGREFDMLMDTYGITTERSAPATPAQNGAAERAGGVIVTRARAMRLAAQLPAELWPEIIMTAGYLNNRTPKRVLQWKTPYEALTAVKPQLSHLHPFGCRAYPLNKHIPRLQKLAPRAFIGYLVGYDSSNIYRIWIPSQQKVIRTRDVTFDDDLFYDPAELDLGHGLPDQLDEIVRVLDIPEIPSLPAATIDEDIDDLLAFSSNESTPNPPTGTDTTTKTVETAVPQLLTPENTPEPDSAVTDIRTDAATGPAVTTEKAGKQKASRDISSQLDEGHILPEGSKREKKRKQFYNAAVSTVSTLAPYYAAFSTSLSTRDPRLHREQLPTEPKTWRQMLTSPYRDEWIAAASIEAKDLEKRGTFELKKKDEISQTPLPLTWVFKYKFDTDGYLTKFKARICVRGDLQATEQETYAATLAARTFRALMAISAAFDLEIRQYDAVNAFVNSDLDEEIHCYCPDGFSIPGMVWRLRKALYGLKRSPLLWYRDLTTALEDLGLLPVPGVNCVYANDWLILFFYVDDVVAICPKQHIGKLQTFENALCRRFEMRVLGELKWFLGIRVIRDRDARKLWLCQDSYITKIANKFNLTGRTRVPTTPLPSDGLPTAEEGAIEDPQLTYMYQQRVGSLNFAAVMSRADIAYPASQLAQHLKKPTRALVALAERGISYLYSTRNYAIEYSGQDHGQLFLCSSDAAYGDDEQTRKSSDGYLFQLFGGPIDWRAAKQRTVATSSTEAELLSLSTAAKEAIWWRRFFTSIHFDTEQQLTINCDNLQTIRILESDAHKLSTRLRHIDIHQHWLRQEVQAGTIKLRWIPTAEMPADGLTKSLSKQKNDTFVKQLNLTDISDKLVPIERKVDSISTTSPSGSAPADTADPGGVCRTADSA